MGELIYYLMLYVCLFCYSKCFVTFDPNNATFTQKIDCTGRVIKLTENGAELSEKSLKMGSVTMKYYILLTGDEWAPALQAYLLFIYVNAE